MQLTDVVIVLNTMGAVEAFTGTGQVSSALLAVVVSSSGLFFFARAGCFQTSFVCVVVWLRWWTYVFGVSVVVVATTTAIVGGAAALDALAVRSFFCGRFGSRAGCRR